MKDITIEPIAVSGINIHGIGVTIMSFKHPMLRTNHILEADSYELKELFIPEGINYLSCRNNPLTSLALPKTLELLICEKELFDYDNCSTDNVNIFYEELDNEH